MSEKRYLGDEVYVEWENSMLKLTTDNGRGAGATIYLEPQVMLALIEFWDEKMKKLNVGDESE